MTTGRRRALPGSRTQSRSGQNSAGLRARGRAPGSGAHRAQEARRSGQSGSSTGRGAASRIGTDRKARNPSRGAVGASDRKKGRILVFLLIGGTVFAVGFAMASRGMNKPSRKVRFTESRPVKAAPGSSTAKKEEGESVKTPQGPFAALVDKAPEQAPAMEPPPDPEALQQKGLHFLGAASSIPEKERVFAFKDGKARVITEEQAEAEGLLVVDLSDDYAPYIFSEETQGLSDRKPNEYRKHYVGVANDKTDEEGNPLGTDQHNYVELFGIPPSLSVLQKRFLTDAERPCYSQLNMKVLRSYRGVVRYTRSSTSGAVLNQYLSLQREVKKAMKASGAKSFSALAGKKKNRWLVRKYQASVVRVEIINQAQLRLRCEGLLSREEKVRRRHMDYATHKALARFERKHMIFGWGQLYGKTVQTLGQPPEVNNHAALVRALKERVTDAAGIIEDGTANTASRVDAHYKHDNKSHKIPNLVDEFTRRLVEALGLKTPQEALAFFKKHPPELFRRFKVAFSAPRLPPYYGPRMRFLVEIDRGDVFYDYPYDGAGKPARQVRHRLPRLILNTFYKDAKVPLAVWPTTVGGWLKEFKDGKVYLKYKNSDVGFRFWRDIVAAPVWIPPESTPPKALVTREKVNGSWKVRVNRDEIGPGFLSAYGLVASYHIQPMGTGPGSRWRDNGIRTHGSVNYMSIFNSFSHGCHRLHNHLAVRLFSFILRHSSFNRRGQIPLRYGRTFTYNKKTFKIRLHTRGYYYTLRSPVIVEVLEGRILGKVKKPIEAYMPVPGVKYDPSDPNLLKPQDGDGPDAGWAPNDNPPADAKPIHPASSDLPSDGADDPALTAPPGERTPNQNRSRTGAGGRPRDPKGRRRVTDDGQGKPGRSSVGTKPTRTRTRPKAAKAGLPRSGRIGSGRITAKPAPAARARKGLVKPLLPPRARAIRKPRTARSVRRPAGGGQYGTRHPFDP